MSINLWNRCMLEGEELDARVSELEGLPEVLPFSSNWSLFGPIIERDRIFLSPPSMEHHYGGDSPGWNKYNFWRATVSSDTRTRPNPSGSLISPTTVGRGAGSTVGVAAMRAYVDSYAKAPAP